MKMPSLRLAGVQDFLLRHGEKFVVGVLGLFALSLVWGGLNALRLKSAQQSQTPQAIKSLTEDTVRHIGATTEPPPDIVHPKGELAEALEPWRPQHIKIPAPPGELVLSRPFTQDVVKRQKPQVFPIEDLRAVAGVAVLPDPAAATPFEGGPGPEAVPRTAGHAAGHAPVAIRPVPRDRRQPGSPT